MKIPYTGKAIGSNLPAHTETGIKLIARQIGKLFFGKSGKFLLSFSSAQPVLLFWDVIMRASKKRLTYNLTLFLFSNLFAAMSAMAASDTEAQEGFARARSKSLHQEMDHSTHQNPADKSQQFHGVFYGYLPCSDCDGVKTTLSLQQKNNYLIVIQPAKQSSREYFERGKYDWNEETRTVILTPTKGGTKTRRYHIEDEGTLIQLNEDGIKMEDYELQRSDTYKSREVHIH